MTPSRVSVVTDTTAQTDLECFAFTVLSAATFTTLEGMTGNTVAVTYPAGVTIFGHFRNITLATGSIVIYQGV